MGEGHAGVDRLRSGSVVVVVGAGLQKVLVGHGQFLHLGGRPLGLVVEHVEHDHPLQAGQRVDQFLHLVRYALLLVLGGESVDGEQHLGSDLIESIGDGPRPEILRARRPRRPHRGAAQHGHYRLSDVGHVRAARVVRGHAQPGQRRRDAGGVVPQFFEGPSLVLLERFRHRHERLAFAEGGVRRAVFEHVLGEIEGHVREVRHVGHLVPHPHPVGRTVILHADEVQQRSPEGVSIVGVGPFP
mmetsp:Transcript_17107/g.49438  ORF Transcript_17107/g.49438 Transcript_17107/m.49438 type:complete len:243 (+) Transcript_17107:1304-2032(+)